MADTHFFHAHPAPADWQERIKGLDPDLWVALNTLHPDGPRWCVLRWVGEGVLGEASIPVVGLGDFSLALQRGWSFVRDLEYPDGKPATQLDDFHILDLFRDDWWRKYGRYRAQAKPKLDALPALVKANGERAHSKAMNEAFENANSDPHIVQERTGVLMPGGA